MLFAPQDLQESGDLDRAHVEALLRAAAELASLVLLDLPSTPLPVHQACARSCDPFFLVVEREPIGVAAGKNTVPLLDFWGVDRDCLGTVLVTKNPMSAYVPPAQVAVELGFPVTAVGPPAAEALAAACKLGAPLLVTEEDSLPAESLKLLAQRVAAPVLTETE